MLPVLDECDECGGKDIEFHETERDEVFMTAEGPLTFKATLLTERCKKCGYSVVESSALESWERDIAAQIIQKVSNPTPEMVGSVRRTFGLTKEDLAWLAQHHKVEV